MKPKQSPALLQLVAQVQKDYGTTALQIGKSRSKKHNYAATGFVALDSLLGGGFERGQLTLITGTPTVGMTSLALQFIAQTQKTGEIAAYIDLAQAFDPDVATLRGVQTNDLILIRSPFATALGMLFDLIKSQLLGAVVFNAFPGISNSESSSLSAVVERANLFLARSTCALLVLLPDASQNDLRAHAGLHLRVVWNGWLLDDDDVYGYAAQVLVEKHSSSIQGRQVSIEVIFDASRGGVST